MTEQMVPLRRVVEILQLILHDAQQGKEAVDDLCEQLRVQELRERPVGVPYPPIGA